MISPSHALPGGAPRRALLLLPPAAGALRRLLWLLLLLAALGRADAYEKILVGEGAHPAVQAAARIMARHLGLPEGAIGPTTASAAVAPGAIVLKIAPSQPGVKHDGYTATFSKGSLVITGARPRSLLFAAGETHLWRDRTSGTVTRDPAFAIRSAALNTRHELADFISEVGCNIVLANQMGPLGTVTFEKSLPEVFAELDAPTQEKLRRQQAADVKKGEDFAQRCRDADVDFFPMLYGNDMGRWSKTLLEAALKKYPGARGTPAAQSWERASLCPSDPATWKILEAYVREYAAQTTGAGLYATFWDNYGLFCQCDRCRKSGMDKFPNELTECVRHFQAALAPLGKKLVVRTWSSGVPHWLGEQWVHAPGYDNFGGTSAELWGGVIRRTGPEVILQTKVYHADCQPAARFSTLLGQARPHPEIAEWQITGQTTGRFYFPASVVNHTAETMRKSLELVGPEGGVSLYLGGTKQKNFDLLDDIANSINVRAWKELSWEPKADVEKIWQDWATPLFGKEAAPHVVKALKLSEDAVNRTFSTLGLGSDTNSGFANTIARRETLLKYTNRYFLPEGQRALAPTLENVDRVIAEKDACLRQMEEMTRELELAKPGLKPEQYAELSTRVGWLREFALCAKALDESLWRYRYLRHLSEMQTTDPAQMRLLQQADKVIQGERGKLFRFDPAQKFSCYDVPLGQVPKPSLGSPVSLMREILQAAQVCIESATGPEPRPAPPTTATPASGTSVPASSEGE